MSGCLGSNDQCKAEAEEEEIHRAKQRPSRMLRMYLVRMYDVPSPKKQIMVKKA
jgi:hypothetical protein